MKYLTGIVLVFFSTVALSQNTIFLTEPKSTMICESREDREAWKNKMRALKQEYYARIKDSGTTHVTTSGHVLFGWPMRANSSYDFMYSYYTQGNYADQDEPASTYLDYHCGDRTYDGHDAQDINLYPFWWRMMDRQHVMAVAAAPGVIMPGRDRNYFDSNCTKVGSANNITILHDDGTTTRYLHLKRGSLTTKPDWERVEQGEFLGFIGSSGHSTFPHLHFAVYDSMNNLIEPYFDAANQCNVYNSETWWQNQRPYWQPEINRLMTHSGIPELEWCPYDEVVRAKNQFSSGDVVYTGIAFSDGQDNDVANCSLIQPNGTVYKTWNVTVPYTQSRQYAVDFHTLPSGNTGSWMFKAVYRSRTYAHFFTVGCKDNEVISGSISGNDGYITGNYISSTAIHTGGSNTKVLYQAANYVELKPGFEARAGIHFKARINSCTYTE